MVLGMSPALASIPLDAILSNLASPWGYVVVGLMATLEAAAFVGLVVPGETALLVGGFLAYQGRASLGLMIAVAAVGAIVGDSLGYEIGRRFGPALKATRLGVKVGERRWSKAAEFLARKGGRAVFFGRFVGVLRALVPSMAGLSRMPYRTFLAWNAAGGAVWAAMFVTFGYLAGASYHQVERVAGRATLLLTVLVALTMGAAALRRRRRAAVPVPSANARIVGGDRTGTSG
jgi:membrane protein DedA with SNARE-associated domain